MDIEAQKKRDLIYFFTHNKNLTRSQLNRRDFLLARDCVSNNTGKLPEPPMDLIVRYLPPKNLHEFLRRFNQDNILKYTCHEIDTDEYIDEVNELCQTKSYNFEKHAQLISKAMDYLLNDFERNNIFLDKKFIAMTKAYIYGNNEKGWSSLNIKTCWKSDDLLTWSKEHEGIILTPGKNIANKQGNNGYKFKDALRSDINGIRIIYFKDLVKYFKSLFHIRRDNSLREIIDYQNKINQDIRDINVTFAKNFDDGIELLTDVDKLIQAYKRILRICKDANNDGKLNIELSFFESNDSVYLTIHDTDHIYGKTLKSTLERIGESQSKLIQNQINGLCNLYIEADFGNQEYAKVGLWTKDSAPLCDKPKMTIDKLTKAKGVKYILEFNWR